MPSGLSDVQLLLIVCGTVLVVLILTTIGYWACYRQKEHHESRSRQAGEGDEEDPLLDGKAGGGEGGAAGRSPTRNSSKSPTRRSSHAHPVPSASKSWVNTYGELGKSQVVTINRWVDEVVKTNSGGYEDIEELNPTVFGREGSSMMGHPLSGSSSNILSPTDSHYIPMGGGDQLSGGRSPSMNMSNGASPRVSIGGVSNHSGAGAGSNNGGRHSPPPQLAQEATLEGPRDPLDF